MTEESKNRRSFTLTPRKKDEAFAVAAMLQILLGTETPSTPAPAVKKQITAINKAAPQTINLLREHGATAEVPRDGEVVVSLKLGNDRDDDKILRLLKENLQEALGKSTSKEEPGNAVEEGTPAGKPRSRRRSPTP